MTRKKLLQTETGRWTRRDILRGAATVAVLSPLQGALRAAEALKLPSFAYVAACGGGEDGAIHVFSIARGAWAEVQRVPSRAPACIVLSRDERVLYVANDVAEDGGLPRGTVEAFSITVDGTLTPLGTRALTLSGTHPRAMALSPDGRSLVVAAYGGGLYSVLPVSADGRLGAARHSYKQVGSGPDAHRQKSAHPHSLVFDERSSTLLSSDFGADRLSMLAVDGQKLRLQRQQGTGAGSGPGSLILHRDSAMIFTAHELEGALVSYRYNGHDGAMQVVQRIEGTKPEKNDDGTASLALHASGKMLYRARLLDESLTAWKIDQHTGRLSQSHSISLRATRATQVIAAPDRQSLYVVGHDAIHHVTTDPACGEMEAVKRIARIKNARFLALKKTESGAEERKL